MIQESVLRIVIDSRGAEKTAQRVRQELQGITTHGEYATKSMDAVSVGIRQLVGQMAGIVTVGAAISKMDTYTGLNNKLKLVTNSQVELNQALGDTFKIAQNTAQAWDSVAMVYQRFADNADRLGISMKQTAALTETVSKAISVSGGSAASAEAALMQFGQALASGVLRGEEFNSIAEQAPGLLKAIAMGMDTNIGSLRAMAAEGKITGDELVKALSKAKPYIDDLFNKTDFTIAQSFTQLSNEVTKFVGAAGAGSGAAAGLSAAISGLANNLSTIANIAVVGGVALLTKTIIAQTVAIYGSITGVMARRAADLAALESQAQLAGLEVQRTRQVAALAAQEVHLARLELNSALTRAERAAATMRLTQAEIALALAEKQKTAATIADTAAQNANNAARSRGAALFAMVGGWTGVLTVGVAALAAGYMYLKSRTAEANAKLEEQGKIAQETDAELRKLSGNDKISAVRDLTAAFNAQNAELSKSKEAVDAVLFAIRASSVENEKARKVTEDARNGVISYDEAIKRLNQMDIPTDLYDQLKKQVFQYNENAEKAGESQRALSALGKVVKLAGNLFQNAAVQVAKNTDELNKNESAAEKAAKAQKGYFDSLNQDVLSANERLAYMNLGFSKEVIDQINKLQEAKQKALGDGVTAIVTTEEINQIVRAQNALDAVKNKEDEITQAKREQNKEAEKSAKLAEKQAVIMAGTNEQTKNMLKVYQAFRNAGVDDVKARVLTAQVGREGDFLNKNLFGSHTDAANRKTNSGMISWQGSRSKSLTQYLQGQGVLDKKGNIEQTQEALNAQAKFFIQEIMTEKRYSPSKNALLGDNSSYRELEKVFGKNAIAWDYNGKNIGSDKAAKNLARQDNYYNSLNKILGGDPENALSSIKDLAKYDDEAYKARKDLLDRIEQLQSQYDTEAVARSKARDEEILQATILSQNDLIPKIKERYDAEDKLAKLQQEFDVEGHKWTEERKLQYTYDTNVLRLTAEGKFSEDQKKIFEKALKEQYEQEKAFVILAKETRLFQAQQSYMHEIDAMQERYRLEIREIDRIADLKERAAMREAAAAKFADDYEKKRKNAEDNFNQVAAKIGGFEEHYALQKEMEDRAAVMDEARKYELISEEEHRAALIEIEKKYMDAKRSLNLSYGEQIAGSVSAMFKQQGDEQNKYYKAAITIEKSFAIARSMIAIQAGIAQAANNPWPLNLAAMASVAAQTASIVSNIKTIHVEGFATGGLFTGDGHVRGPGTSTSDSINATLSDYEFVTKASSVKKIGVENMEYMNRTGELPIQRADGGPVTPRDTYRVGMGTVNAINRGASAGPAQVAGATININNNTGAQVNARQNPDGSVDIDVIERQLAGRLGNPNSTLSKSLKQNTTASRRR